jgi:hypothetical protein
LRCVRPATHFGGRYCSCCKPLLCECECAGCTNHDYSTEDHRTIESEMEHAARSPTPPTELEAVGLGGPIRDRVERPLLERGLGGGTDNRATLANLTEVKSGRVRPDAHSPKEGDAGGCEKPRGAQSADTRGVALPGVPPAAALGGSRWGVVQGNLLGPSHETGPQSRVGMMAPLGVASPALPGGFPALKASGEHETGPQSRVGMMAPFGVASPALPGGFPALKASGETCPGGSTDTYPRREAESRQRSVRGCSNGPVQRAAGSTAAAIPEPGTGVCLHQSGSLSSRTLEADSSCPAERQNAASTCSAEQPSAASTSTALTLPADVSACVPICEGVVDAGERAGCVTRIAVLRLQRWWRGRTGACRVSPVDVVSPAGDGTAGDGTQRVQRLRSLHESKALMAAVMAVQRRWRDRSGLLRAVTSIEAGWVGQRAKRLGSLAAHVRFLQWAFRSTRGAAAGCWRKGRLRAALAVALAFGRDEATTRCAGGANLATAAEFAQQRRLAGEMLDWYSTYVAVLRRLQSGTTPFVLQDFVGGGGSSEGCRRAGGASHGIDLYDQEDYRRRFGSEAFTQADGLSWSTVKALQTRHAAKFMIGGPPCKFYSQARIRGEAKQPPLIDGFRDMCQALFGHHGLWAIENVMGAAKHMAPDAAMLDGHYFGLRVARARLYETNFGVHIDQCVRAPADLLASRCCLGRRRRFRRFDQFGRPVQDACCSGNLFALQGVTPWRCTLEECSEAMGVDSGHMSYERLAQSVPPAYGQLVFSQMCMRYAHMRFGVPVITFDDLRARPSWARRTMAFWLRGAGASEASAGQLFSPAPGIAAEPPGEARAEQHQKGGCAEEAEFRELFYSHAGGYDRQWVSGRYEGRLGRVSNGVNLESAPTAWDGCNTYVERATGEWEALAASAAEAARRCGPGTRATFVVEAESQPAMEALGFERLACSVGGKGPDVLEYHGKVAMIVGSRAGVTRGPRLRHDDVRGDMDWRDRGDYESDPVAKATLTWQDYPHDPERYKGKGLPEWVERMMVEGAAIDADGVLGPEDVEQYSWPDGTALVEAILETERHLAIGALEYVPDAEVSEVLEKHVVHPILLVSQGKGKFRACHDYSRGTNRVARSSPFVLPSVWDARDVIKPSSFFCKYDLRDGFFAVPVHPSSRNYLVVRHPATGRLLRCARLPFGYRDSPRLFCGLTEAVADEVRRRAVGKGVHIFVFVDDFLCVGDDAEAARLGGELLEQVLHEFGIPWAPHKQRGPARCMEFLGLLLSNVPGHRCVALTEKRQRKLRSQIDEWLSRRPSRVGIGAERASYLADARELASFLGHLVFCSQVVPQGRTYMQAMLSQFAGLEVDWRRGEVRLSKGGAWRQGVKLGPGFWRDLDWWHHRFESRNCTPLDLPTWGAGAVCGTDASDWGTGQLMWDNGQRAETVLRFTLAERARSINWRELLGIVRVLEQFGAELRGRKVLVEGDNTSSLAAAENESSKAEDSQELVRRLVELAELHEIVVRFTHTPGVKLDRPDQTSRGDPIEEARVRVRRREYRALDGRYGPFTEWLGAERRFAEEGAGGAGGSGSPRIWAHPAYATVGSALRRLGERLGDRGGKAAAGLVVVPHDERAKWWPLVRHFSVVGRWPAGSRHLECNQFGQWVGVVSKRPSLILSFPRHVGGARSVLHRGGDEQGYVRDSEGRLVLPLPVGAFVYSPSGSTGERGELMIVQESFDPAAAHGAGEPTGVMAAEMLMKHERGKVTYALDVRKAPNGSFCDGRQTPWEMDVDLLYDVTAMVTYVKGDNATVWMGQKMTRASAKDVAVYFDYERVADLSPGGREEQVRALARDLTAEAEEGPEVALAAARASADEAAAARTRVVAAPKPTTAKVNGKAAEPSPERVLCKSAVMRCAGCHGLIGWGRLMEAGGRGMVHVAGGCRAVADATLAKEVAKAARPLDVGANDSLKRHVQFAHRFGAERIQLALQCLDGACGDRAGNKLMCVKSCGRGVHGLACAGFSAGVIQLGNLTCAYCRAEELVEVTCTPSEKMVRRMVESMLAEATTGKANTHKGYSDLAMLERKWQVDVAGDQLRASDVKLPHTSMEGTYSFCLWLAGDGGRSRSMGTVLRQLSSLCAKLEIQNFANTKKVKALLKDLEAKGGAMTTPDTQVTSLMILETYGERGSIAKVCGLLEGTHALSKLFYHRETTLNDFELVGGMRVAEVCGGGDGHGLLANNVCIQRVVEGEGSEYPETIEARIEDSKTGYARWTVFQATTNKTKIEAGEHLRLWWKASGLTWSKERKGAFVEERPDYWVVRVSFMGMDGDTFKRFLEDVQWSREHPIVKNVKATLKYAKLRKRSETLGEEMRYVNVAGGPLAGNEVVGAKRWLDEMGYARFTAVVMGPLIRATLGHALTHMPYAPDSTHVHLIPAMELAFERVKQSEVVDPEYDQTTDQLTKFGNHSNRRHADRVAMRNAAKNGVSEEDIDFYFGWDLRKMAESMRRHYAGLDRVLRLSLSRVTAEM